MTDEQVPSQPQGDPAQDAGTQDAPPQDTGPEAGQAPGAEASPLPPDLQAANASKDEHTWAMVGHLAALGGLVIPTVGCILGPLIVWLIKREESAFVAYHAKQSMWFQIFAAIVVTALTLLAFCTCVTAPLAILAALAALGYAIYGAIQVSGGKDFEYYWVGPWVRESG
jgi:uncharacterized Tic20 family protein